MSATGRVEFHALGTGCVVVTSDAAAVSLAHHAVVEELAQIDASCSRFRPDSDLERVNDNPGRAIGVSTCLLDALDIAMRAARITSGDLDPTIGSALIMLGYDRDFAALGGTAAAGRIRVGRVRGWQSIHVDRRSGTVSVPVGIRLDLGATAKAWAADRSASAAARLVGCGVLVSLGGDISVANEAPAEGWVVALADRHDSPPRFGDPIVAIRDGGLATSSTTVRRWQVAGTAAHHILDPNTSQPAPEHWRTVSVAAASAVDANIASTTCIIRGERALDWLAEIGLPARLVHVSGAVTAVNGWPVDRTAVAMHS
ncbi:MAG TPA: FAD:protein FMN transferase [Acidimicrobiia bacterium]